MPASWNRNRVAARLGIEYPIVQGPLGGLSSQGLSSQRLAAAVSNFGGLESFGAHRLQPDAIKDVIAEIRSFTSKPECQISQEIDEVRVRPTVHDF